VYTSELDMDLSEWLAVLLLLGLLAVVAHTAWTNRNAQEAEGEEFRYMTVTDVMANGSFDDKDG
jgi:predicted negative regulator of RcsB-dependent stress response